MPNNPLTLGEIKAANERRGLEETYAFYLAAAVNDYKPDSSEWLQTWSYGVTEKACYRVATAPADVRCRAMLWAVLSQQGETK